MHTERVSRSLPYSTDLSTVPQLKDGSFDFGNGVIGPSEADREFFNLLREQSSNLSVNSRETEQSRSESPTFKIPKALQRPFYVAMTVGGIGFVLACGTVTQGSDVPQSSSNQVSASEGRQSVIKEFSLEERESISLFFKTFESVRGYIDEPKAEEGMSYEEKVASLTDFVKESARDLALINRDPNFDIEVVEDRGVRVSGTTFHLENPVNSLILTAVLENRYRINLNLAEESADNGEIEALKLQEEQIMRLARSPIIMWFADHLLEVYPAEKWAEIGQFFGRVSDLGYPLPKFIIVRDVKVGDEDFGIGVHIKIPVYNGPILVSKKFFDLETLVHEWGHMFGDLRSEAFADKNLSAYKRMVDGLGGNNELSYISAYPLWAGEIGLDVDAEDYAEVLRVAYVEPELFQKRIDVLIGLGSSEALHAAELLSAKANFAGRLFGVQASSIMWCDW